MPTWQGWGDEAPTPALTSMPALSRRLGGPHRAGYEKLTVGGMLVNHEGVPARPEPAVG